MLPWWRRPFFLNVTAGVVSAVIYGSMLPLLSPLGGRIVAMGWDGFAAWLTHLGWFLFTATSGAWAFDHYRRTHVGSAHLPSVPVTKALTIHRARYGLGNNDDVDVTDALRQLVVGNRFDATITNDLLGGDPVKGQRKTLWVSYSDGEATKSKRVRERERLVLP